MAKTDGKGTARRSIVIKKEEVIEGGHHGGAWKVAYADFVTAMMAFFLLMWLLNATTEQQRKGLADYFSPSASIARSMSGNGAPFGGHTPYDNGSMASDRGAVAVMNANSRPVDVEPDDSSVQAQDPTYRDSGKSEVPPQQDGQAAPTVAGSAPGIPASSTRSATSAPATQGPNPQAPPLGPSPAQEQAAFRQAAAEIRHALQADPQLAELAHQIAVDMTPEGLRIQIMDEEKRPMFATGSATLNDRARALLQKVAPVLLRMPEPIAIAGHTDAAPYRGTDKTNWELSSERANATRRLLVDAGLPDARLRSVTGDADRDPLLPADPFAAANRRIAIVVLRQARPAAPVPAAPSPVAALPPGASGGPVATASPAASLPTPR